MLSIVKLSTLKDIDNIATNLNPSTKKHIKEIYTKHQNKEYPKEINEDYFFFISDNVVKAYSYFKAETDIKKATAMYDVSPYSPSEITSLVIDETSNYLFDTLQVLDINWLHNNKPHDLLFAGAAKGYDCCLDEDMVIYSKDYQDSIDFEPIRK